MEPVANLKTLPPGLADELAGWGERFSQANPKAIHSETMERLQRLVLASPLYARLIEREPSLVAWLENSAGEKVTLRLLQAEWRACAPDPEARAEALRSWRRRMSMLVAYRSVNGLTSERETTASLTGIADFCLREAASAAFETWKSRHGQPWDDDLDRPARFVVLALGKMGAGELNFSSDIDLLFVYEGDGQCRRGDGENRVSLLSTVEFFTKVAETITQELSAQTESGFMFRVDNRLRPEGNAGPLVRSLLSLENYYATAGQTWERLAFIRARPIAGELALGGELLEVLQPFRYPRHPPLSLLAEIAAMKHRAEHEKSAGGPRPGDIKTGRGGIREVEFITQTLQLLHAGRFPFLQTHSTQTALEQLAQYGLLENEETQFLIEAYWFLRAVENRIQMREERQTHDLPESTGELSGIAASLGFADTAAFQTKLDDVRLRVRKFYEEFFTPRSHDEELEDWWHFFTTSQMPPDVRARLVRWFEDGATEENAQALRIFVCGDAAHLVTREQITRFRHIAPVLDTLMLELARPALTLRRLAQFAGRYGSRNQFLSTCSSNPVFLRALALLFDRSTHAHALLCAHPEIFEEVIRSGELRQQKDRETLLSELAAGPEEIEAYARWIPLYVRAEQLRYAIGELLHYLRPVDVEQALSLLADSAVEHTLARLGVGDKLLVVALGKYGGAELTFGSDLDLLYVADKAAAEMDAAARSLAQIMRGDDNADGTPAFAIDARLRPHGEAGPLVTTLDALRAYHLPGDAAPLTAQAWERQMLTRARCVCGSERLSAEFEKFRDELLFAGPIPEADLEALWAMRMRIERERDVVQPPQRAFKTAAGGLIDFEFYAQSLQLRHGWEYPRLRTPATRTALRELSAHGFLAPATSLELLDNYEFLKRIEIALRRDANRGVSILPAPGTPELQVIARWLGFRTAEKFWESHIARLSRTRAIITEGA